MSPSRYELSDLQWEKIKDFLPGRKESVGRTAADNRLFVNGVLWVLRSGARWADLPERYGKYKSVHKRFVRWANTGVWERVFHGLVRDKKNQYLEHFHLRYIVDSAVTEPGLGVFGCDLG
jgi:transposase